MKERIIVRTDTQVSRFSKTGSEMEKSTCDWKLNFYLVKEGKHGRSANELRQFKNWRKNPRLDKTIEKIPIYRAYVMREIA